MMTNLLQTIHDPRVRDLVWVMAAPSLMGGSSAPCFAVPDAFGQDAVLRAMPQLLELDRHPAALHDWIAARSPHRLGRYFETLLEYWLSHLMGGRLVAANLPVKAGDIVMGEYDFLWRDVSGALNHWEASVKCYLQVDAAAGLAGYVGTLTRDRLDLKFAHLRDKQLKLAATPAGEAALPHPGEPVSARALLKGWLFYPHGQTIIPAPEVSPQHLSGWWLRWGETAFNPQPGLRWKVLPRLEWLAPAMSRNEEGLQTETDFNAALEAHFVVNGAPLLVAGLTAAGNAWQEVTRGFVVAPSWNLRKA
ncbi:DUF1853 family protein [Sulfuriferula plumbiphila]|uniref:DUF1853 family protein n=1 Tax=Sulfuriferula plumbiphila TaxID=171865 RepID=UPI0011BDAB8C|nr:DUF1853 family protein [Sulfuriferula plumbiphila]